MPPPELVALVPSLSGQGAYYRIERQDGQLWCSCPAFSFGKNKGVSCKHVKVYEGALRAAQRCQSLHGRKDGGVCMQCLVSLVGRSARKVATGYVPKPARTRPMRRKL
mgnify:CR=1 FL=1